MLFVQRHLLPEAVEFTGHVTQDPLRRYCVLLQSHVFADEFQISPAEQMHETLSDVPDEHSVHIPDELIY